MEKRRVVITGMGVVAPNGIRIGDSWDYSSFQSPYNIESRIQLNKNSPVLI
jgi:hypothetical protein